MVEFFDEKVDSQNVVIPGSIQDPGKLLNSALVLVVHIVGLVTASIFIFNRKDVLS